MARPKKPVNRFEAYQQERQEERILHIEAYLKVAKSSRAQFKFLTDLADMVAAYLVQVEGKPCHGATLLRNLRYRGLLMNYMAGDVAAGAKSVKSKRVGSPEAQALMVQNELEIANLKRENARLKTYVAELKALASQPAVPQIPLAPTKAVKDEEAFIQTCQTLLRVLENFNSLVTVDLDGDRLLDAGRYTNNVIADKKLAAPFIEWLRANKTR